MGKGRVLQHPWGCLVDGLSGGAAWLGMTRAAAVAVPCLWSTPHQCALQRLQAALQHMRARSLAPLVQPLAQIRGKRHALTLRCSQAEAAVAYDLAGCWAHKEKGNDALRCSSYNFPLAFYPPTLLSQLLSGALGGWEGVKAFVARLAGAGALRQLVPFGERAWPTGRGRGWLQGAVLIYHGCCSIWKGCSLFECCLCYQPAQPAGRTCPPCLCRRRAEGAGQRFRIADAEAWRPQPDCEVCFNVRGVHFFRGARWAECREDSREARMRIVFIGQGGWAGRPGTGMEGAAQLLSQPPCMQGYHRLGKVRRRGGGRCCPTQSPGPPSFPPLLVCSWVCVPMDDVQSFGSSGRFLQLTYASGPVGRWGAAGRALGPTNRPMGVVPRSGLPWARSAESFLCWQAASAVDINPGLPP